MSWSPRYLMNLAARGQRPPSGSPDTVLHEALTRLSVMDAEQVLQRGASVRSLPALHLALDAAQRQHEPLREGGRLDAMLRLLVRQGAALDAVDPHTRLSVAERILAMGTAPAVRWAVTHLGRQLMDPTRPPALAQLIAHGSDEALAAFPAAHPQWARQDAQGSALKDLAHARASTPTLRPRRRP